MTSIDFFYLTTAAVSFLCLHQTWTHKKRLDRIDQKLEFLVEAAHQKEKVIIENDLNSRLESFQKMRFSPMRVIR